MTSAEIVTMLSPLVVGPVAAVLTEALKKIPSVPFEGKTVTALVLVLGLVSLVCQAAIAVLTGNLSAINVEQLVTVGFQTVAAVLAAAGSFGLFKKAIGGDATKQ